MVAAEINEEVEAALWQEIEEAREQEQFMEAQDTDEALDVLNDESTLNEPVTDVEPPAEAPAQESDAQPAEAKTTDIRMQENRGTLQIFGLDLSLLLIRIKATQGLPVRGSED